MVKELLVTDHGFESFTTAYHNYNISIAVGSIVNAQFAQFTKSITNNGTTEAYSTGWSHYQWPFEP